MADPNSTSPVTPSVPPAAPPTAKVEKTSWPFPLIWIVPLLAAVLAGYFFYQRHQETGVEVVIRFDDGGGLKPSETAVAVAGVIVGHVREVDLADDHKTVLVHVRLETKYAYLTKANTKFWVVRPEVSLTNVTGLNTIVSGPYIDTRPGDGAETREFNGLPGAPKTDVPGIRLTLYADQVSHVSDESPVTYRGIQVGQVRNVELGGDTAHAAVNIVIWARYENLVRSKSVFWVDKGADLQGSLLGGVKLNLGSVQSLLVGGVAFATPEKEAGTLIKATDMFELHDQPKDEWLHWHALINLDEKTPNPPNSKVASPGPQLKHD